MSGAAPISKARIYLMAASSKGYGTQSDSLLVRTEHQDAVGRSYVLSGDNGGFTLTDYGCSADQQIYLLALGGNVSPAGSSNAAIALIAALGPCPIGNPTQEPMIVVNEATTVASVYSLSGFITGASQVSSSGTPVALAGVRNAFATRFNLVSPDGFARRTTPAGNGSLVSAGAGYGLNSSAQSIINQLANILNTCVSSSSGTSPQCCALFKEATPSAANGCNPGTAPTDTVSVLRNINQQTDCNVQGIYNLSQTSGPFQPVLSDKPYDWSISVTYATKVLYPDPVPVYSNGDPYGQFFDSGTGLPYIYSTPNFIAVDSRGNVWFTSSGTGVEKLGPQGQELLIVADGDDPSFPKAWNQSYGLAIDHSDNVWITSLDSRLLAEFSSQGAPLSGQYGYSTPATARSASQTNGALAIDSNDEVWLLTLDGQLCNYSPKGTEDCTADAKGPYTLPSAPPTAAGDRNSLGLAIDPHHHIWFAAHSNDNDMPEAVTGAVGVVDASRRTPVLHEVAAPASTSWQAPMFLSSNDQGDIWVSNQFGGTTATTIGGVKTVHYQSNLIAFRYDEAKNQAVLRANIPGGQVDTGLCMPRGGAVDGDDSFWVGNFTEPTFPTVKCGESLSHFHKLPKLFPSRGIGSDVLKNKRLMGGHPHHSGVAKAAGPGGSDTVGSNDFDEPFVLAIDPSGNIWIAEGESYAISELIGAAVPVVTPLSPDHLGLRP
ncbi:MAG: hypothetical protein WBL61_09970 [Bryobacteraceae bacterium]